MISDDLEALALADAIGALDAAEQRDLEVRLAQLSPEDRQRIAQLYDVAVLLGSGVDQVELSPHVRDRVMAATKKPGRYTLASTDGQWFATGLPGIDAKVLSQDRDRGVVTMLIRAAAGAVYPSHSHSGPEECYVLRGSARIDGRVLRAGDFHHADAHSDHGEITTDDGVEVLIVGAIDDYLPGEAHAH
jgi:anti-sigma factor ChrR (cupin superfamily)